jgi:hypothetical protein
MKPETDEENKLSARVLTPRERLVNEGGAMRKILQVS